jgi:antitoxin component HigA of HigAB toxin-antitoxin module
MDLPPIRTDEEHRAALVMIETCWGAPEDTEEGRRLDALLALVEAYEAKQWPMGIGNDKPLVGTRRACHVDDAPEAAMLLAALTEDEED